MKEFCNISRLLCNFSKMTDRRSARTRKTVDYSKFSGGDSDNDDDFRESSTQSTKRKKNESSSPKSVKVKLTKVDADSYKIESKEAEKDPKGNEDSAPKKRLSVSDKVFQRQLGEALEISKQEDSDELSSKSENENSLLLNGQGKNGDTEVDCPVPNDVSSINGKLVNEEIVKEPKRKKTSDDDEEWNDASSSENEEEDDGSEWSDQDKETKVKKPAVKSRNSKRNQNEEDESDWSDDDERKKTKKPAVKKSELKKQPKKTLSPKTSQSPKPVTPKPSKSSKKLPGISTVSLGSKPAVKTPGTPCQVISSPVKLPPKGIRLGLSRKVSGKPLHSVVKVQQ